MEVPAKDYIEKMKNNIQIIAQETRTSYLTALGLIFTVNVSVLLGSITLADKLNLSKTNIAQNLAYISWGILGIATFLLAFAILIFLVQQAKGIINILHSFRLAINALKDGKDTFIMSDSRLFLPYSIAFCGFVGFVLGLLNILLAILSEYIHICSIVAILSNSILIVISIMIIFPVIKNNKSIETMIKGK